MPTHRRLALTLPMLVPFRPGAARAQTSSWPAERPVRIIIAWPPGGTTDFVTRLYARHLGEALGTSLVVDNRPGGGGCFAWRQWRAPGRMGSPSFCARTPWPRRLPLMPDLGLEVRTAFAPIALLVDYPSVLAVPAALPARTLPELLDAARKDPAALN